MQAPYIPCLNGTGNHDLMSTNPTSANCPNSVIIGIYGLPGSGKSFLLNILKLGLSHADFSFYDGSQVIAAGTPGGLEAFQNLNEDDQERARGQAIRKIKQESFQSGKSALVAGHAMFWAEGEGVGQLVCTQADLDTYTHIIYLDVPARDIAEYRSSDQKRSRPAVSIAHLSKWQQEEKSQLRQLCRSHDILFTTITQRQISMDDMNTRLAQQRIDEFIMNGPERPETVLVFDADKTLAPQDSSELFWELASTSSAEADAKSPLKNLFSSRLHYSYTAFRQATLLCEEAIGDDEEYDDRCEKVALTIKMYSELLDLLHLASGQTHVRALVLTCGLRRVWEKVLKREGLATTVTVVGGGRLSDALVMTPALKAALVTQMLQVANQAIVVTGDKTLRSASMDEALTRSIGKAGFLPRQAVLPSNAAARLDASRLPLVQLTDQFFVDSIFIRRQSLHLLHATDRFAAKLLMTPTRDASVFGPALRDAHSQVGWYLATEFCTQILGVETYQVSHVQGHQTDGYRVLHEEKTLIVPLMRGGEPMALGINKALPLAMFLHAKNPSDVQYEHLQGRVTIFLVDSVINTGQSILEFVRHIRHLHASIRIIVVAGVIQAKSVSTSRVALEFSRFRRLSFIALRLSDNQFTGRGSTDTGHRLFNTVHLDQ
ncbi:hypothetical protein N7468_008718 [Penicillium chermesinum]|uniref:Phosphoribosyltransferase domain-containing protein n=1 Tax=Penicillium chermesinum TaxID=63820 RepID=A0A9W9TEI9_9EURO|nr:uncharacterized protein N7468_008718 [Penicillium chermesinum]KAJ5219514.1 hypothetical protein N7468_008718 [Penicillium chermesinum]